MFAALVKEIEFLHSDNALPVQEKEGVLGDIGQELGWCEVQSLFKQYSQVGKTHVFAVVLISLDRVSNMGREEIFGTVDCFVREVIFSQEGGEDMADIDMGHRRIEGAVSQHNHLETRCRV